MDLIGSFSWIPYILRLVYYTKYIVKKAHKWQQWSKMCCTNPYPNLSHNSLDQLSISLIFHNNLPKFLNLLQNSFWPLSLLLEKIFFFFFLFWFWSKPHRKRNCSFLHSTRVLMRSLNFDDHPFMQYTFGQSKGLGPRGKQIFSPEL